MNQMVISLMRWYGLTSSTFKVGVKINHSEQEYHWCYAD